jgi:N-acetylmuramoyl-L-alanine amidase
MKKVLLIILYLTIFFAGTQFSYAAPKTPAPLAKQIKILIVPGHDDETWGAQYGNIKESDMNLNLSTRIYNSLKKDKRFDVHITRNTKGYTKEFADYFKNNADTISLFKENAKIKTQEKVKNGSFIEKENPPHNNASEDTAIKLYGINKWANENKIDAVIHVHFNDYPRANKWKSGIHKGFVIYMPEEQMVNSKESVNLAKKIFAQLHKKYTTSTYEEEKGGLIINANPNLLEGENYACGCFWFIKK